MTMRRFSSLSWQDVISLRLFKVIKAINYQLINGVLNIMERMKSIKQENHNLSEDKT